MGQNQIRKCFADVEKGPPGLDRLLLVGLNGNWHGIQHDLRFAYQSVDKERFNLTKSLHKSVQKQELKASASIHFGGYGVQTEVFTSVGEVLDM